MKKSKPWFRAAKGAWYVTVAGEQVRLGPHPEKAPPPRKGKAGWVVPPEIDRAFHAEMSRSPQAVAAAGPTATVAEVCDRFLDFSQRRHAASTYGGYKYFLGLLCNHKGTGRLPASDFRPIHVTEWIDAHAGWDGGRRHAVLAAKSAFAWADAQGVFAPDPLRKVKAEPGRVRERVLSEAERAEVMAAIRDRQFKDFVSALLATGCRPSEVARVTAADVDLAVGTWIFGEHKTRKKTRKARVVYLTDEMVEMSRRLIEKHPEGPIFRARNLDRPFTRHNVRLRFTRLRKKLPHLPHFVAYNCRATYATEALVRGVGVAQVAELLGHTSTEMVTRHYGKLASKVEHMREAAKKAAGG